MNAIDDYEVGELTLMECCGKRAIQFIHILYSTLTYNDKTELFSVTSGSSTYHFKHIRELNLHTMYNESNNRSDSLIRALWMRTLLRDGNREELLTDCEVWDFIVASEKAAISRAKAASFVASFRIDREL